MLKNQQKKNLAFVKKNDPLIEKELRLKKFKAKIIKVDTKNTGNLPKKINNKYFLTESNKANLFFVLEILKKFKINNNLLVKTIQKFNGLKYRQQIIYRGKYLTIINDSKSTSFSSSISLLKSSNNIYWLLGGISKKGDKFDLPKKYFNNVKAFVYGRNKKIFNEKLKNKITYKNFKTLNDAFKQILKIIKKEKFINKTILFSPSAASFDNFKNFEDRGLYFNKLVKSYINDIK